MSTLIVILDVLSSPPHRRWLRRFEQRLRDENLDVFIYEPGAKAAATGPVLADLQHALGHATFLMPLCSPMLRQRLDDDTSNTAESAVLAPILDGNATASRPGSTALPQIVPVLREGLWRRAAPLKLQYRKANVVDLRGVDPGQDNGDAPELARLICILKAAGEPHRISAHSASHPSGESVLQSVWGQAVSVNGERPNVTRDETRLPPTTLPDWLSRSSPADLALSELAAPDRLLLDSKLSSGTIPRDIDPELRDSILSVASFLGSEGGSEEDYIEIVLQLRFGAGVPWMRRFGRWLSSADNQIADPGRREEVLEGLRCMLLNGELLHNSQQQLCAVADLNELSTYSKSQIQSAFRAANQQS